ncbi:MAG: hypothetical protein WD845_16630 [Pirellulales bacterium]
MAKKKAARKPVEKPSKPADATIGAGSKQTKVTAKAKQARVATSGLTSRVRGHVTARTKRNQAKRDSNQAKRG